MEKINRTLLITTTKKEMKEDPDAWTDPPRSQILGFNALKIKIPGCSRHGAAGSVSMVPQLRLRFNPWPGNFHMPWVQPKRKKKKKNSPQNTNLMYLPMETLVGSFTGLNFLIVKFAEVGKEPKITRTTLET